jgi:hypothetical protein
VTNCAISYPALSHLPKRRWTLTIPAIIVGGAIVGGLWAGHHQPEPVSCEPGSTRGVIAQTATSDTYTKPVCLPDTVIWTTPGYDLGKIGR